MKLWITSLLIITALHAVILLGFATKGGKDPIANVYSKMGLNAKTSVKITLHSETTHSRKEFNRPINKIGRHSNTPQKSDASPKVDGGEISAKFDGDLSANYSWASRRRGEEGNVRLLVRVHTNGKAHPIKILKSSGFKRLDKSALEAVSTATFTPAYVSGAAIESTLELTIAYRLR